MESGDFHYIFGFSLLCMQSYVLVGTWLHIMIFCFPFCPVNAFLCSSVKQWCFLLTLPLTTVCYFHCRICHHTFSPGYSVTQYVEQAGLGLRSVYWSLLSARIKVAFSYLFVQWLFPVVCPKTSLSICLVNVCTWVLNRHFTFNIPSSELHGMFANSFLHQMFLLEVPEHEFISVLYGSV